MIPLILLLLLEVCGSDTPKQRRMELACLLAVHARRRLSAVRLRRLRLLSLEFYNSSPIPQTKR